MFQFQGSSGSSSEKGYICDSDSDGDKVRKYIQLWIAFFVICVACNTIVLFFLYFLRIPLKKLALESSKISLFSLWILFKIFFEWFIIALIRLKSLFSLNPLLIWIPMNPIWNPRWIIALKHEFLIIESFSKVHSTEFSLVFTSWIIWILFLCLYLHSTSWIILKQFANWNEPYNLHF